MYKGLLIEDDEDGMRRARNAASAQSLIPTYKVYLRDDIIWDWVKNYEEFVIHITENGLPDFFAFDHDLGQDAYELWNKHKGYKNTDIDYEEYITKTGFHCADWLVNYCLDNDLILHSEIHVHSMNPKGRENIASILSNFQTFQNKYKK